MDIKEKLIDEIVKNGHKDFNGNKVWHMANRSFLYLTPEMSNAFIDLLNYKPFRENIFDVELKLIRDNIDGFIDCIGKGDFNLIDIGCGDGSKAKEFIEHLNGSPQVNYYPIDSEHLTSLAVNNVKKSDFKNIVSCFPSNVDYSNASKILRLARKKGFKKNVVLLHGSIIASYEINDYLFNIVRAMSKKDCIIIGNSIRKGERLVELEKYKNLYFEKWFVYLIRYLGFKDDEVEYDAKFNEMRVEGFFRIKVDKVISFKNKKISFKKGDEILVAILYKYYYEELEKFFRMYFSDVRMIKDSRDEYVIALCKK